MHWSAPVMTVGVDGAAVETALRGGGLGCPGPGCSGRLAPWGWARPRRVRGEAGWVRLRPRRSVCGTCRVTHVLLPASVLLRRADEAVVIGAALLAKAGGWGHRRAAVVVGRPASTVRGWLRRMAGISGRVLAALAAVAAELGAEFTPPAPSRGGPVAAVVEWVGALARAAARWLGGSCSPWRLAALVTGGRLLSPDGPDLGVRPGGGGNTSWPWAGGLSAAGLSGDGSATCAGRDREG